MAQQINYSINCQLLHELSSVADIPFHLHFLSQNSFVWITALLSPLLVFTPSLTSQPPSHSFALLWQVPLSTPLLILFFSIVSLCLSLEDEIIVLVISLWEVWEPLRRLKEQHRMLDNRPKIMKRSRVRALGTSPQNSLELAELPGEERRGLRTSLKEETNYCQYLSTIWDVPAHIHDTRTHCSSSHLPSNQECFAELAGGWVQYIQYSVFFYYPESWRQHFWEKMGLFYEFKCFWIWMMSVQITKVH